MPRVLSVWEEEQRVAQLRAAEEDRLDARDRADRRREKGSRRDAERERRPSRYLQRRLDRKAS